MSLFSFIAILFLAFMFKTPVVTGVAFLSSFHDPLSP